MRTTVRRRRLLFAITWFSVLCPAGWAAAACPAPLPPYGTVLCANASVTFTGWNFPDGSPEPLQALCECAGALSRPLTISCLSDPAD